jgi:hypothetical protein
MTTFDTIFRAVVIALVGIVALVALALSYDALYLLASQYGHTGWKAYAWPALIDLPLVVFTLAMLYAQIRAIGRWTIASFLGLVLAYTGVTVYLNYLESDGSIEGVFVRVSAPVGLFVCTEVLRHLFKFELDRKVQLDTLATLTSKVNTKQQEVDTLSANLDTLTAKRDTLQAQIGTLQCQEKVSNIEKFDTIFDTLQEAKQGKKQERVDTLLDYLDTNPDATLTEAANENGVSRQTISNYVNELSEIGKLHKNGKGWEVAR